MISTGSACPAPPPEKQRPQSGQVQETVSSPTPPDQSERLTFHPAVPGHPAFARAGWFRTDDAGRVGPDGRLRILGRLDEALSVGGLTLLPQALEDAFRRHAAVVDVVVVGIPDPRLGTRPVAAVTLRSGATPDELRAHVTGLLGERSAPAAVAVVGALPTLPGGKVDRRAVAAGFVDGTIAE